MSAPLALGWQAGFTLAVLVVLLLALVIEFAPPDLVFLACLGMLLAAGVLEPEVAFQGLASSAVITVASLFVVAHGLQRTGALGWVATRLAPRGGSPRAAVLRLAVPTAGLSAIMNNTPLVALLIPVVQDWERRFQVPASRLLLPLSYASILGGMLTLMGCSTNVLVSSLLEDAGHPGLAFFEITALGAPVAALGLAYLVLFAPRLLPDRQGSGPGVVEGMRDYQFELEVPRDSPLEGRTVQEAGLRSLREGFLAHLHREDRVVGPVSPSEVLTAGDTLVFVGGPEALARLLERGDLSQGIEVPDSPERRGVLPLFEAVVAPGSRFAGQTLRQIDFRRRYQGVVLGIQRSGEPFRGSLGKTPLQGGDLLLVEARPGFDRAFRPGEDFYLVAPIVRPTTAQTDRSRIALSVLVAMVVASGTGSLPLPVASFLAALAMVLFRCLRGSEARQALNLSVLLVIAGAMGIGHAIETTGLARWASWSLLSSTRPLGPVGAMMVLLCATSFLACFVTNYAAAVIAVPVALSMADELGRDPRLLVVLVAIATAANFATPVGYQTNLMVMGAGGYRFADYVRVGLPLHLITLGVAATVLSLAP